MCLRTSGERDFFFGTRSFRHIEIIKQRHTYTVHTVLYLKRRQTRVFFVFHSAVAVGVVIIWTVAHNTRNKNKIARFRLQFVTRSSTLRQVFFSRLTLREYACINCTHTHELHFVQMAWNLINIYGEHGLVVFILIWVSHVRDMQRLLIEIVKKTLIAIVPSFFPPKTHQTIPHHI